MFSLYEAQIFQVLICEYLLVCLFRACAESLASKSASPRGASFFLSEARIDAAHVYIGIGPGWYGPGWVRPGWY